MADKAFMSFTQNGETLAGGHSLLVGGSTMEYRALVNDVAKFIMENYDGSTLAGSTQTIQSAVNALNSRSAWVFNTTSTIISQAESLPNSKTMYFGTVAGYGSQSTLDSPDNTNAYVEVYKYNNNYITIKWFSVNEGLNSSIYTRTKNGGTWGVWIKQPSLAEFDNLKTGGRNLIVNTLNAVADPVNFRPHLLESTIGASGRGTCTAAEHGLRFTIDSSNAGNWQYLRFGSSNASSVNSNLMGLEVGKDYTWSFDIEYKLLSGRNETSTDLKLEAQLWTTRGTSNSFGRSVYQTIHEYKASDLTDRGTVLTDHVEFTFTVPDNATRLYLDAKMSNTDVKVDYLKGDYIELRNIKLEKGNRASDWSPALEDLTTPLMSPSATATTVDANAISSTGWLRVASDSLSLPVVKQGMLYTLYTSSTVATQFFVTSDNITYYRQKWSDWQAWVQVGNADKIKTLSAGDFTDANDLRNLNANIIFAAANTSHTNVPSAGFLINIQQSINVVRQILIGEDVYIRRYGSSAGWTAWVKQPSREEITADDFTSQVTVAEGEDFTSNTSFVRIGKTCHIIYQGASKAHEANAVICTLPEGYRPAQQTFAPFSKNGNAYGTLAIFTNGNIALNAISSTTAVGRVCFNATYFIS